eukprot:5832381-Amphidinium_carterae.1
MTIAALPVQLLKTLLRLFVRSPGCDHTFGLKVNMRAGDEVVSRDVSQIERRLRAVIPLQMGGNTLHILGKLSKLCYWKGIMYFHIQAFRTSYHLSLDLGTTISRDLQLLLGLSALIQKPVLLCGSVMG